MVGLHKVTAKNPCWSFVPLKSASQQIPHLWQGWRNKWLVYRGWNLSGFRCFPSCLSGPQSELTNALVSLVTQQSLLCKSPVDTVGPPVSHSCLCCPCSASPWPHWRACSTLSLAGAKPWEAVFFGRGLKVTARLLRVTCWVSKFLPSWTTPNVWGGFKSIFAPPATPSTALAQSIMCDWILTERLTH